jgi:ribose 5-phosphate isomerase B
MKIVLASDHGGYDLKEVIKKHLTEKGYDIMDLGTNSEESVDYPDYGYAAGEVVAQGKADCGIVFCGSGIGICIAANKVKGIRCALLTSVEMAVLAKSHNDANIISLGGRLTPPDLAIQIVDTWLTTDSEGGRHQRRIDKLNQL